MTSIANRKLISVMKGDRDLGFASQAVLTELRELEARHGALCIALAPIAAEMRREHDIGDGHFTTEQVEIVEAAVAKFVPSQGSGK